MAEDKKTNIWTELLQEEQYEKTNGILPYFNSIADDLQQATGGKVTAQFHNQRDDHSYADFSATMNELTKRIQFQPRNDLHKDANILYEQANYVFDILTDTYRFRLLWLTVPPVFPVEMSVDEGVFDNVNGQLTSCGRVSDKKHSVEIDSQDKLEQAFEILLGSRKLQYVIKTLQAS